MQIGGDLLMKIMLKKKLENSTNPKNLFHASLLGNGLNIFQTKI
jgi:hypothetical protein